MELDLEVSDMDGDGHLDLITASRDGLYSHIYYNDGNTNFDIDSDGNTDILVGNFNAPNYIMLNRKAGQVFEEVKISSEKNVTYDIVAADLNKDAGNDIMVGNSDGMSYYYFNPYPTKPKKQEAVHEKKLLKVKKADN